MSNILDIYQKERALQINESWRTGLVLGATQGLSYRQAKQRLNHWFEKFEISHWWEKN